MLPFGFSQIKIGVFTDEHHSRVFNDGAVPSPKFIDNVQADKFFSIFARIAPMSYQLTGKIMHTMKIYPGDVFELDSGSWFLRRTLRSQRLFSPHRWFDSLLSSIVHEPIEPPEHILLARALVQRLRRPTLMPNTAAAFPLHIRTETLRMLTFASQPQWSVIFKNVVITKYATSDSGLGLEHMPFVCGSRLEIVLEHDQTNHPDGGEGTTAFENELAFIYSLLEGDGAKSVNPPSPTVTFHYKLSR